MQLTKTLLVLSLALLSASLAAPVALVGIFSSSTCGLNTFENGEAFRPGACVQTIPHYTIYDCSNRNQLRSRTFSDINCTQPLRDWQDVPDGCGMASATTFSKSFCIADLSLISSKFLSTSFYANSTSCSTDQETDYASLTPPRCETNGPRFYSFNCNSTHEIYRDCSDDKCQICEDSATPLTSCRLSDSRPGRFSAQRCYQFAAAPQAPQPQNPPSSGSPTPINSSKPPQSPIGSAPERSASQSSACLSMTAHSALLLILCVSFIQMYIIY